jgi:hypothetical protein
VEYSLLFSGHNCEITRVIPKGIADYENLVHVLPRLSDDPGQDMLDAFGILEKEKQVSNRSSNIIICSSRITEELIQELIAVKQQQRNPMLFYVVPSDLNSRELEDVTAPLRNLDQSSVLYRVVAAEAVF